MSLVHQPIQLLKVTSLGGRDTETIEFDSHTHVSSGKACIWIYGTSFPPWVALDEDTIYISCM